MDCGTMREKYFLQFHPMRHGILAFCQCLLWLLIQYKPEVKAYWKGLIFAGVSAFIGEPFFTWLGFYIAKNWNTLYSFPIYFFI
jgi:uncharacterized membrane protein